MLEDDNPNGKVSYTVKELLQDIRLSIAAVDTKLDTKADKADVRVLESRVDAIDRRQEQLSASVTADQMMFQTKRDHRRWFVPIIVSVFLTIISPILWVVLNHLIK